MNKLLWRNGCILLPAALWKYKTARRVPDLFVTLRSKDVAIELKIIDKFLVFKETNLSSEDAFKKEDKIPLEYYKDRYLMPEKIGTKNILDYLNTSSVYIFTAKSGKMFIYIV